MGCTASVPVVDPDSPHAPESVRTKSRQQRDAAPILEGDGSRSDPSEVVSSHASMDHTFAKDYRIIRNVGGTVSQIFMVVKNHKQHQPKSTTATVKEQPKLQSPASVDATNSEGAGNSEDLNLYVMQVIDMKFVAPERRESIKEEIKSLKRIEHANSELLSFVKDMLIAMTGTMSSSLCVFLSRCSFTGM